MTAVAVALLAAVVFVVAGWLAGALADRLTPSPLLREQVWSLAFALPVLAAVIPAIAPLFPRPVASGPPVLVADLMKRGVASPPTTPATPDLFAATWEGALDHGPTLLVAVVMIGAAIRLAGLVLRHRALSAASRAAAPLDREDLAGIVAERAAALGVRTPAIALSDRVRTPVLVGLMRPSILVPRRLAELPRDQLALICAHELAHLKHGDNLRLLAEDLLLALLWFSPPQAAVHQRLVVAREEARDALALSGAAPAERRRYAETLVEILRMDAGPGLKTAFIGTGSKGTAARLKAILKPCGKASRRHRLAVGGLALLLLAGAGAGSLAIAAQTGPTPKTTSRISGGPLAGGFTVTSDFVERRPHDILRWHGDPKVTFDESKGAQAITFMVDGRPAPADFQPDTLAPETLAFIEGRGSNGALGEPMALNFVLKTSAIASRAKYERADAVDFQRYCASSNPRERNFCAGVLLGLTDRAGVCAPEGTLTDVVVNRTLPAIARANPRSGEPLLDFAVEALAAAWPCA